MGDNAYGVAQATSSRGNNIGTLQAHATPAARRLPEGQVSSYSVSSCALTPR